MSKLFVAGCLSLLVLFVGYGSNGAVVAQSTDTSRFLIGILRFDGIVVPFAQYSKGAWSNPWPKPNYYSKADPNTVADLKSPWFARYRRSLSTWYFWSSNGDLTVLKTSKTVKVENHCQSNWGLLSDFRKETTEDSHHSKAGVVLNVKQKIEGIVELTNKSTEWSSVSSFIRPTFERLERIEIAKAGAPSPSNYFPRDEDRKKIKLTITNLYRNKSKINGQHLYYFEAKKEFLKPAGSTDEGCNNISLFYGWVLESVGGRLNLLDHKFVLTDCDMKESITTLPIGILNMRNRVFVIAQNHGYEDETYSILELSGSRIRQLIETAAGGC